MTAGTLTPGPILAATERDAIDIARRRSEDDLKARGLRVVSGYAHEVWKIRGVANGLAYFGVELVLERIEP